MTDANYEVAFQLLKQRYDNEDLVIQSHIRSLLEAPRVENPSTELQALLHSHEGTKIKVILKIKIPRKKGFQFFPKFPILRTLFQFFFPLKHHLNCESKLLNLENHLKVAKSVQPLLSDAAINGQLFI